MNDEYISRDLGEVAALVSNGCPIKSVQWKGDTGYFVFGDVDACNRLSRDYFFGDLKVNARTYYDTIRMVKRKIYESTKGGGRYVSGKR